MSAYLDWVNQEQRTQTGAWSQLFGPLMVSSDVRQRLLAQLVTWLPAYVAEVERQMGIPARTLPLPHSWELPIDVTKIDVHASPLLGVNYPTLVTSAGVNSKQEAAQHAAIWQTRVVVMYRDVGRDKVADMVGYYMAAIRGLLMHQGRPDGIEAIEWTGEDYANMSRHREFHLGTGAVNIRAHTHAAVQRTPFPREVPADPYAVPDDIQPVETAVPSVEPL